MTDVTYLPERAPNVRWDQDALHKSITQSIRAAGLLTDPQPALPPPNDTESEELIIGALLSREIGFVELGDLAPEDFYSPLHRWLAAKIEAAELAAIELTPPLLMAAATSEGISPDGIAREIEWLWSRPYTFPNFAREAAARIVELSRRRRLIAALERIVFALRTGTSSFQKALDLMNKRETEARTGST